MTLRPTAWLLLATACAGPTAGSASAGPSPLRAAARTIDLTPAPGAILVGFGARVSTEVRDPLEASVLVLRGPRAALALVTLDLPALDDGDAALLRARVAAASGVPHEAVLVAASHTHSAPMLGDDAWSRAAVDAIAHAAGDAATDLEPAHVELSEGRIGFDVNRRLVVDGVALARPNPAGARDGRVRVMSVVREDGSSIALVVHAVCHPNVLLGPESTRVSADFPGEARRALGRPVPVLFVNGSAGDVRPRVLDADGAFRLGEDADVRAIGDELASAVEGSRPSRPPGHVLAVARSSLAVSRRDGHAHVLDLAAARVGDALLVTIPGEPLVEIGLALEARLLAAGADEAMVIGYANGYADYIVTHAADRHGGYEVARSMLTPDAAVRIEDALVELGRALLERDEPAADR